MPDRWMREAREIVDEIDRAHGFDQWRQSAVDEVRQRIASALQCAHKAGAGVMREYCAYIIDGPGKYDRKAAERIRSLPLPTQRHGR